SGGIAPGMAPTSVFSVVTRFSGVYTAMYDANVIAASRAGSVVGMVQRRYIAPVIASSRPNVNTSDGDNRPAGSGRLRVRSIRASVSRSSHWLRALAPDATRAVPRTALNSSSNGTFGRAAYTPPAPTVNRTSTEIFGRVIAR